MEETDNRFHVTLEHYLAYLLQDLSLCCGNVLRVLQGKRRPLTAKEVAGYTLHTLERVELALDLLVKTHRVVFAWNSKLYSPVALGTV